MGRWVFSYIATAATFLVLDVIWLSTAVPRLYRPALEEMLAPQVNLPAAAAFYLIFTTAIVYLAVARGVEANSIWTAAIAGAVLGLAAYAAYDLTNMATLKMWSLQVSVIDMAWGTCLTAAAAAAGCAVMLRTA
jgi:uncharacterized membrane protein